MYCISLRDGMTLSFPLQKNWFEANMSAIIVEEYSCRRSLSNHCHRSHICLGRWQCQPCLYLWKKNPVRNRITCHKANEDTKQCTFWFWRILSSLLVFFINERGVVKAVERSCIYQMFFKTSWRNRLLENSDCWVNSAMLVALRTSCLLMNDLLSGRRRKPLSSNNGLCSFSGYGDPRNYTCHQCGEQCCSKGNLAAHYRNIHCAISRDELAKDVCPECNKQYSSRGNMLMHFQNSHQVVGRFVCPNCSKTYSWKHGLARHLLHHHNMTEQEIKLLNIARTYWI